MRERSTWNRKEIAKKAADGDIYTMNQDHPQPAMDEYVIGDSSDFAEDVHSPNTWEAEYSGDAVKRNEIGFPEFRSDTFNHSEKTASDRVRLKKAELCVAVAKLMMGAGRRYASADSIEDQAVALMYMPDMELINTHKRLAQEQGQSDQFEEDDEDEGQSKQAGQVPPQFKENIEKMKAKSQDADDDDDEDDEDEGQSKQAQQQQQSDDDEEDDADQGGQQKQAGDDEDDDDDEIPEFIQKKIDDSKSEGEKKQASKRARTIRKIRMAMGQQQQLMAQMQQLLQQAIDQQEPVAQDQEEIADLQGGPAIAQQQQLPVGQQQQFPVGQQQDLEQLLANDGLDPLLEDEIEIAPAGMDTEQVVLAGQDEILRSLFAQEEESDDEGQGQGQGQSQGQAQAKQAGVRRTASTRTVGTRPTGVAKLGGSVSKTASKQVVDSLSSLWASAPDVRSAFGLK